jgi:serine/threonine-protein kinase
VAAARLGSRVLGALAAAHGHGIVHRDIKPSNLFLPGADLDQAKLLDFGIARWTHDDLRVTRPGKALGTPMYMAPEQTRDGDAVDARADVFSLGCVLYECATGEPPPRADEAHTWGSAETIEDPASRESFLTRIPEHRRILELARELAAPKS